ncbi:histidinol-phosphate transaminase [Chloroflexota bacterium]
MSKDKYRKRIEKLVRQHIIDLDPYQPIVPLEILSKEIGIPVGKLIKLDGNENPYGCSPRVKRAIADYNDYHVYPDSSHLMMRRLLERYVGVGNENIVVGSGSDELIDLILRLYLEPGDEVINCVPTFGMYSYCTSVNNGKLVEVPRDDVYAVNIDSIKNVITKQSKVIFIASPNNPTGNVTPEKDIIELLNLGIVVVVDEAYFEFHGVSVVSLVRKYENLIVLRSFSKWAGLAGLRVGYGVFHKNVVKYLNKIKPPYNVNIAAQIAVRESLADIDYMLGTVKAMIDERQRLYDRLEEQGILKPIPSEANFILCRAPKGKAKEMKELLESGGIFVRHFETPVLKDMIRISVGKPEHTDALIEALQRIGGKGNG